MGLCPRDGATLCSIRQADLPTRACDACGGCFVASEALAALVHTPERWLAVHDALPTGEVAPEGSVHYLPCPCCGTLMNRRAFARRAHIVIDTCRDHGTWFDAAEFRNVIDFLISGGLERAHELEEEEHREAVRARHIANVREMLTAGLTQAGALAHQRFFSPRWRRDDAAIAAVKKLLDLL